MSIRSELCPLSIEYLEILQEECAEVIQAISKIKRFGLMSHHPEDPLKTTNIEHLIVELGDVIGMIQLLADSDDLSKYGITEEHIELAAQAKKKKVAFFVNN